MIIWPRDNIWQSNFTIYFTPIIAVWYEQKVTLLFLSEEVRQFYLTPDSSPGKGMD